MKFRRAKIISTVIFATFLIFSLLGCGPTGSKDSGGDGGGGDTVGSVVVSANPSSINADGATPTAITVRVTDSSGGTIADNTAISLSTTRGMLTTTSGRTTSGEFLTTLTSASVTGDAVITATAGGVSGETTVNFISSDIAVIFLTADPNNLRNDGSSRSTIEALITDSFGNIVSDGLTITFTLEAGSSGNLLPGFTTTVDGIATVEYVASTDIGVQTIRAEAANGTFDTIEITLTDVEVGSVNLTATPDNVPADGTSQAQITATVRDESGFIVSDGTPVSFTTTAGTLSAGSDTTLGGMATVLLTSPAAVGFGFADITASSAGVSDTARVTLSGVVDHIVLSATPINLDANGTSTSELRAVVYDDNNNVIGDGEKITFEVISGSGSISIPPTATTTNGIATVTYMASAVAGTEIVRAQSNNGTFDTVDITLNPAMVGSITLVSGSNSIVANGASRSRINATVKDTNGHLITGAVVNFVTTAGTLSATSVSTASGLASVLLTSSTNLGTATVTADADGWNDSVEVNFIAGPVDTIFLTGIPGNLSADGSSQSTIRAVARDAGGNPIFNETITFNAVSGDISQVTDVTNVSGIASITYTVPLAVPGAGVTGTDIITAVSTNGTNSTFTMNINAAQVDNLDLSAGSSEIVADGASGTLVTATVYDGGGVVQDGTTVSFSTTAGSLSALTATTVNGIASVTLTSPINLGSATITASAGGVSDMTNISFIAGAVSSVAMTATPDNLSADGISASTVRAVVSDVNGNPITGETISFSALSGTLSATADTNTSGVATVTYTAPNAVPAVGTDTITAEATNGTGTSVLLNILGVQIGSVAIDVGNGSIIADGVSGTPVTVSVADTSNHSVPDGTTVNFSTTTGSLSASSAITVNGFAGVTLTSPTNLGSATVTATAGGKSASTEVIFVAGPVAAISLTAVPNNLSSGVSNSSVLYATATDANGNPVDGERIDFSAVSGSVNTVGLSSGFGVTDENGFVTATYFAPSTVPVGGSDTITVVSANGTANTADISIIAVQIGSISLSVGSSSIVADGSSGTLVRATVTDANGNDVIDGTTVTFSTTAGTILPLETAATVNGIASVTLRSSTNIGTVTVSGTSGGVNDSVSVLFIAGSVDTVGLTAIPVNLTADGISTSVIQAAATDAAGNPIADETISFSGGSGGVSAATAVTNASGIATVTYTVPGAVGGGTDTVTGTATNGVTDTVSITLIAAPIGSVSLSAGSNAIVADGISSTQIRAVVKNNTGNDVADGTVVNFTATAGSLSAPSATTTAGIATVTLTSAVNLGTADITATVGGLSSSTTVNFTPGAAASMTVSATPANLTADGTSISTIRVTVLDAHDNPVDGETLTFSAVSGTLTSLTATTANGVTNNQYTAPASVPGGGIDTITVQTTNGVTVNTPITLIGPAISSISLSADPQTLPADGATQATITATLTIVGGGSAPDGTPVSFSIQGSGGGSISPTGTTAGGNAIATLTSGNAPETVTIRAEAGGRIAEIQVEYTPGSVTVTIIPNSLLGTGEQIADVTAIVLDAAGDPVTEAGGITFTLDDGSLGILIGDNPADVTAGEATINFQESARGGTVTISATWRNAGVDVTGSETIDIQPPPAFIEVADGFPDPTSINIKGTGGQSTSQVIFDIKDSQGFPVADGYRVDFVIDSGPDGGEAIQPLFALTAEGKVSTILRSGLKSGPVSIKATYFYDTDVSTTMSQITINAGPPVGEEFGIFAQYLNISGLGTANLEDNITVNVGDIYGNPVPDNTAISFKTYNTGGFIETADALTGNNGMPSGMAQKVLHSGGTYTQPLHGVLSVTAEANNGGRTTHVTALAMPPSPDNNYIYAGTDGGGVYKSLNAGASWKNISRSSTIQGQNWIDPYVNDLAVDPDDANTIYAATGYLGRGHLYRSLSGGLRWNSNNTREWNGVVALSNSVLTVLCDDGGSDYVWAGTEGLGAIFAGNGEDFQWGGMASASVAVPDPGDGRSISQSDLSGTAKSETWTATYVVNGALPSTPEFSGSGQGTMTDVAAVVAAGNQTWTATYQGGFDYFGNPVTETNGHGTLEVLSAEAVDTTYTVTCIDGTDESEKFRVLSSADGLLPEFTNIGQNYDEGGLSFYVIETTDFVDGDEFSFTTSADSWAVSGSSTGAMTDDAQTDVAYTSDSDEISFTINTGSTDYRMGDEWSFETSTFGEWQVTGSVSGMQNNVADTHVPYLSDNGEVSFTITSGTTPFATGDTFTFTVTESGLGAGKIVRDIVKVPGSGNGSSAELYAATPTGVFRSIDGGTIWTETTSFTGDHITTLEAHPTENVVYAGTLDAGVWFSSDSGGTWSQFIDGLGEGISATAAAADSGNTGNGVMSIVAVDTVTLSENWTVTCISEVGDGGVFTVVGTVSGSQTNQATVGAAYISDGGEVAFTIADGSVDFALGDSFTFSTTRDQGRHIKDLLVDDGNDNLYAITYFWGAAEPHAVGNVYVHGLVAASGLPDAGLWSEANLGLPEFSGDDPTLLAQHVLAPDTVGTPSALYIGGEGISLSKATSGLGAGAPLWQPSQSGMTNLIMSRMPILFSGECEMIVFPDKDGSTYTFTVYIQDTNGNPPISESAFVVQKVIPGTSPQILFKVEYPDTYIFQGTWRDPTDTVTNNPFVISATVGIGEKIELIFTPANSASAPGSSGFEQKVTYY